MVYLSCMVIAKDFNAAQQALTPSKLMHLATYLIRLALLMNSLYATLI